MMSSCPENLSHLIEITGLSEAEAQSLLQVNNFSLEQALNFHLEATLTSEPQVRLDPYNSGQAGHLPVQDFVRAPIPSKREQLVTPEDDNFRFRKRRIPAFTVCPLRNFAREAEIQEEELNSYFSPRADYAGSNGATAHNLESNDQNGESEVSHQDFPQRNSLNKKARLEDLFRPPIDILFWGTFRAVRDHASLQNRWLIVNLQDNSEFKSQVINRDVWSDRALKELVQKYFVLWQVSVNNPEGLRFKTFYKVDSMPYVCIIDPRTGEEKQSFEVVSPQSLTCDLNKYLSTNSYCLDERESNSPASSTGRVPLSSTVTAPIDSSAAEEQSSSSIEAAGRLSPSASTSNSKSANELSEEDQIALAIKNSLTEQDAKEESNRSTENEIVIVLSDSEDDVCSYESFLGSEEDPTTIIHLRLPNGEKTIVEWPSSTKLRAIRLFVQQKYPEHTKEPYKIISAFPRRNILELERGMSLAEADLHPRAILHLHPDV